MKLEVMCEPSDVAVCAKCGRDAGNGLREVSACDPRAGYHGVILTCWDCVPLRRRIDCCQVCVPVKAEASQ